MFVLVDYDNQRPSYFGRWSGHRRSPNYRDHAEYLSRLMAGLLDFRQSLPDGFLQMRVRLYGGWSTGREGHRTESAEMIAKAIREYPRSFLRGSTRVILELAEGMLSVPETSVMGTVRCRPWPGLNASVVPLPKGCIEAPRDCRQVATLKSWLSGKCHNRPRCPVLTSESVEETRQKLVDSLMVADTIVVATEFAEDVAVVSRDDDLIPGLFVAARNGRKAFLVRFGTRQTGEYDTLLTSQDILIYDLQLT